MAKWLEKTLSDVSNISGILKRKRKTAGYLLFPSKEAKLIVMNEIGSGEIKFKGRPFKIKEVAQLQPPGKFRSIGNLIKDQKQEAKQKVQLTEEQIGELMAKPLEDQLIPFHSLSYED